MDIKQIKDSLNKIFNEENKRIIFWYDGEKEFEETTVRSIKSELCASLCSERWGRDQI